MKEEKKKKKKKEEHKIKRITVKEQENGREKAKNWMLKKNKR